MRAAERPLRILAGVRRPGRCPRCGRKIVFVVTAPRGKYLPFDREPLVLHVERNEATTVAFEVVTRGANHFDSCRARAGQSSGEAAS